MNFSSYLTTFFLFLVFYLLYRYILNPYRQLLFYKKQEGVILFHWELISFFKSYRNSHQKKDFYYLYKETFHKNPKAKFLIENFGSRVLFVAIDPSMVREILFKHEIYQKDKSAFQLMMDLTQETTAFNEGLAWKKRRKIVSGAFNFEFVKAMIPITVEVAQDTFNGIINSGTLKGVDLVQLLASMTGETTGRLLFGRRFSSQKIEGMSLSALAIQLGNDVYHEAFSFWSLIFGSKFPKTNILPRHRRLNKKIATVRARCKEILEETERMQIKEDNLINKLLELRRNSSEDEPLSDDQIIGESIGLFAAGTDTTANIVNFAVYFLSRDPLAFQKVKEEVDREFADINSLNIENLSRMEYTTAFLKEALRIGAGCLFYRIAMDDDNLCGVEIKKGTMVNVFLSVCQASERYYSEPDNFIPERWLPNTSYSHDGFKNEPFSFIPFSAGPRNCVGQHLAMVVAKILLGMFIKTFSFKVPSDFDLKFVQGVVLESLDPLLVDLEIRN